MNKYLEKIAMRRQVANMISDRFGSMFKSLGRTGSDIAGNFKRESFSAKGSTPLETFTKNKLLRENLADSLKPRSKQEFLFHKYPGKSKSEISKLYKQHLEKVL